MLVYFRVDASSTIGHGHVIRTLTLANALRERGAESRFVCREHEGDLCDLIESKGFSVTRLPKYEATNVAVQNSTYADCLGVPWDLDLEESKAALASSQTRPDWLVVDHYSIDKRWELGMREMVGRTMVIDDLADRQHDCDLLLDQNLVADMQIRYAGKVPEACTVLLGPSYALLQPIYAKVCRRIPAREGAVKRICIYFGGADGKNLAGTALSAVVALNRPDIDVDVVVTPGSSNEASIRNQAAPYDNVLVHCGLPSLAALMANADLAIGAGGATTWERLCLGLPTMVITLAENQLPIAAELDSRRLIRWLGHENKVDQGAIAQALLELVEQGLDVSWSKRCMTTVDGKGADRVCAVLTIDKATPLVARYVTIDDENRLFQWANDRDTRNSGFSAAPITNDTHHAWFCARLREIEDCHFYIVEAPFEIPVGQVRFARSREQWEVHYAVAPQFRKRGVGRSLLEAGLKRFRTDSDARLVFGRVKPFNAASCRIFESLGFNSCRSDSGGMLVFERRL